MNQINNQIFFVLYNLSHQSAFFDSLIVFIGKIFPFIVILLAGIFLLFHHDVVSSHNPFKEFIKKWKEIIYVFFSGFSAFVVAALLKGFIHMDRSFVQFNTVLPLFSPDQKYSFPSSHATFFSALAVSIFLSHKKAGYIFMFFAFLIGLARIIAGVHFPLDILAGFALGAGIAFFLKKV